MNEIDVELSGLVYGGDAIGRLADGRAVFVPYALPGERVRVRLVEEKRGHARAELVAVLRPSPKRIAPRCPHFGACGGCHYQHLAYPDQLAAKTAVLREQIERIAGIANPPLGAIVPAPRPWNYRNTVQFSLTPEGLVGYQRSGSHEVVAVRECHLPEDALNEFWPQLAFEPGSGIQRVEVRLGVEDDLLLTLESDDPEPPEFAVDLPVSAVHLGPAGPLVLAGDEYTVLSVHGRPFRVSAGAFFQVHTAQAEAMVDHLLALLPLRPDSTILDVYCGVGLFSAFLAPRVARLVAIELSPAACGDFAVNLDEFENVELYEGAAEVVLPALFGRGQKKSFNHGDTPKGAHRAEDTEKREQREKRGKREKDTTNVNGLKGVDAVVVDPPRAGVERAALEALIGLEAPALVYVSCDPATLARDARRLLQAGYRLAQITPFDLFPQTYAVESISLFER